jgi:hypothetical protein
LEVVGAGPKHQDDFFDAGHAAQAAQGPESPPIQVYKSHMEHLPFPNCLIPFLLIPTWERCQRWSLKLGFPGDGE